MAIDAKDILTAAAGHIDGRGVSYDSKDGERSMESAVGAFKCATGVEMTAEQGWLFMLLLKVVRSQKGDFKLDNYEDGAAYFALAGEQAEKDIFSQT